MLSFAVFDGAGVARDFSLRHAFLLGPDDTPINAEIRLEDGLIRCQKRTPDAAALSLQFRVEPVAHPPTAAGEPVRLPAPLLPAAEEPYEVSLQTCLLPEREWPYLLSLELARHRLMLIINKLEDWALFDLPADDPVMVIFEAARHAFTAAVTAAGVRPEGADHNGAGRYTPEADRLARHALSLALDASELLALRQAKVLHAKRTSGELAAAAAAVRPPANALTDHETVESRNLLIGSVGVILPSPPQVGCCVAPEQFTPGLQNLVASTCDFIRMPMRWVDMEPTEGKYAFAATDRWIEWAVRYSKLPVTAGPVIDFRPRNVPEWLYIWEHDYESLREFVYEHIKNIVTRYRRTVSTWTVVSGLHTASGFSLSLDQVMDLTRICILLVRKLQPGAQVQVEIDQPWGEGSARSHRSVPPMAYAEMINQAGLNVDAFALRIQMGQPEPGRSTRDLMAFSALLDRYATLEKPIAITALGVPSQPPSPDSLGLDGELNPGFWRAPWSPEAQTRYMTGAMTIAASKPYVRSICWYDLYDTGKDPSYDALATAAGEPRPAARRFAEIRQAIREKRFPLPEAAPAAATGPA